VRKEAAGLPRHVGPRQAGWRMASPATRIANVASCGDTSSSLIADFILSPGGLDRCSQRRAALALRQPARQGRCCARGAYRARCPRLFKGSPAGIRIKASIRFCRSRLSPACRPPERRCKYPWRTPLDRPSAARSAKRRAVPTPAKFSGSIPLLRHFLLTTSVSRRMTSAVG